MNAHKRVESGAAKGVCGYWHRGAGLGVTVSRTELATCPKCRKLLNKQKEEE